MINTIEFVIESNKIEGVLRPPTLDEINEHDRFINLTTVTLDDLKRFVHVYQPNARLRDKIGLNVMIGNYRPPSGRPEIVDRINDILYHLEHKSPYDIHVEYETLHPFTDGNGRSGRALWAWGMKKLVGHYNLGFLHTFYYQALDASGR